MGGLGSVVVAVLMMVLLVPGAGVGAIPNTSTAAWLNWEMNFAGFMVNWMGGCFFVDGFRVAGFSVAGCWRCGWLLEVWLLGGWLLGGWLQGGWLFDGWLLGERFLEGG